MRAHSYSRDGLHHGEAHHDGAGGVVVPVVRQPTDAVVAVSQDLDPQLVVFLEGRYVLVRQWIGHKSLARCPAVFLAATAMGQTARNMRWMAVSTDVSRLDGGERMI